jgi:hypothetical protein
VIPAHDESAVIGRLLTLLTEPSDESQLEVTVVCNGCRDDTADVARTFGVRVLETPIPSKMKALRMGDKASTGFPRLYIDADVEIDRRSVDRLITALSSGEALAAATRRIIPMTGVSWLVHSYYTAWQELRAVRESLWGRGVVGFAAQAHPRVLSMPDAMSDDLALSLLFTREERAIVQEAVVVVHPPRTLQALLVRKIRSLTGNRQLSAGGSDVSSDQTTSAELLRIARRSPRHLMGVVVLVGVAVVGRWQVQRRSQRVAPTVWGRDNTSRLDVAAQKASERPMG